MLYHLSLDIGSDYAHPVATGRHVLRVMPLAIPGRQVVETASLVIRPEPESRRSFDSFFGGNATGFVLRQPHEVLTAELRARIRVSACAWHGESASGPGGVKAALGECRSVAPDSPHHFVGPSPRITRLDGDIAAYAAESAQGDDSVFAIARRLTSRIHRDFRYDGRATTVDTTPEQAFALRKGVCQDFSHIMIAALRALGIPAGYVSGYLRTLPPHGKPKLVGADAMHAWVRVWCGPAAGWIEFDPTNDMLAGDDHIVAGYGRDYADIAPLAGTLKGLGGQKAFQRVDITVLE